MLPIPVSSSWEVVAADCLGPLIPSLNRNKYVFVMGALLTKYVEAARLTTKDTTISGYHCNCTWTTSKTSHWQGHHLFFQTYEGSSSRFHPNWDCFIDRINDIILQTLKIYFDSNQKDWDAHLPAAFYAHNASLSETTVDTTFFLTNGR